MRIYERQVSYEIARVPIEENSVAELAKALAEFGTEEATWTVELGYIVLTREMGSVEVPVN